MKPKKILIVDENGFGRICSALLEMDGYRAEHRAGFKPSAPMRAEDFGLVITSYPYGAGVFESLKGTDVPVLVLSDCISDSLMEEMNKVTRSYCMVKPIDYDRFNVLIGQVLSGEVGLEGGCRIV
ncbi:hypothetical protein DESUT3_23620 [Desulfuromonas versatilis]|uniref:Response regulator receiver protein n=1 Tax=Desulfuromonas versatilis TaxID=2802975 RepID=A0ABM8HXP4_9BACT|nr:DNA-binding response regulator [Desulfuromonas versatilis]BCR05293.1 hypothetical protein DESUT3_23620 [Desulfuromonas versatilis]